MPGSIEALWPQAYDAFREVDAILHAGDLHTLDVVDELNQLAPTYVARAMETMGLWISVCVIVGCWNSVV